MSATHSRFGVAARKGAVDEVIADPHARDADRRPATLLRSQATDAGLAHEALDALAADALAAGEHELGMARGDPWTLRFSPWTARMRSSSRSSLTARAEGGRRSQA